MRLYDRKIDKFSLTGLLGIIGVGGGLTLFASSITEVLLVIVASCIIYLLLMVLACVIFYEDTESREQIDTSTTSPSISDLHCTPEPLPEDYYEEQFDDTTTTTTSETTSQTFTEEENAEEVYRLSGIRSYLNSRDIFLIYDGVENTYGLVCNKCNRYLTEWCAATFDELDLNDIDEAFGNLISEHKCEFHGGEMPSKIKEPEPNIRMVRV